jgi:hypothetical protein
MCSLKKNLRTLIAIATLCAAIASIAQQGQSLKEALPPMGSRAGCARDSSTSALSSRCKDFAGLAQTKLSMPMLVLSGEKAGDEFLIDQGRMVATNVTGVIIKRSGHWLIEEAPEQTIPALMSFINGRARYGPLLLSPFGRGDGGEGA